MSEPFAPTIIYPNGGESIAGSELTIRWDIRSPLTDDSREVSYEIYYTDDFDPAKEPDWRQIAVLPSSTSQYVWRFGAALRTTRGRVAIRARNSRGERSSFAVSAGNFSIRRKKFSTPALISPSSGERFDKYLQIVMDDSSLIGTHSQRSTYQFFYSSETANVPNTSLAQNIPLGSDPVLWSTVDLPPANDYVLQVYLADDEGNRSDSAFVRNLSIVHEGFFIIDTAPPVGSIIINDNATFTKNRNVSVEIVSYDDATAVHSIQLIDNGTQSKPLADTDIANYQLSDGDAVKSVQLLMQDFGANRNNDVLQRLFEKTIELENTQVTDIAFNPTGTLYAVTSGSFNYLYSYSNFPKLLSSYEDGLTAVAYFNGDIYVTSIDADNKGSLLRYTTELEVVEDFGTVDSIVNTMTVHNDVLFLGMENGSIYTFDGVTLDKIVELSNPAKSLVSDNNLLYLVLKNDSSIYIYNGETFFDSGA